MEIKKDIFSRIETENIAAFIENYYNYRSDVIGSSWEENNLKRNTAETIGYQNTKTKSFTGNFRNKNNQNSTFPTYFYIQDYAPVRDIFRKINHLIIDVNPNDVLTSIQVEKLSYEKINGHIISTTEKTENEKSLIVGSFVRQSRYAYHQAKNWFAAVSNKLLFHFEDKSYCLHCGRTSDTVWSTQKSLSENTLEGSDELSRSKNLQVFNDMTLVQGENNDVVIISGKEEIILSNSQKNKYDVVFLVKFNYNEPIFPWTNEVNAVFLEPDIRGKTWGTDRYIKNEQTFNDLI